MITPSKNLKRKVEGFSLIEISIVLLIVGIIVGSALKGRDLIAAAQIKSVASDVECLRIAYSSYVSSRNALPGDDRNATNLGGKDVVDGDGDGVISEKESEQVFQHLFAAGLIDSPTFKTPKIGGKYKITSKDNKLKLKISDGNTGIVTKKQLISLKAKLNELLGENGSLVETDPANITPDDSQKYVVEIQIN